MSAGGSSAQALSLQPYGGHVGIGMTGVPIGLLELGTAGGAWGGAANGRDLTVHGGSETTTGVGQISVQATDAFGANLGGGISFGGEYSAGANIDWATLWGRKENATDGNTAGYMQFNTRPHGGNMTERMTIASAGTVNVVGTFTAGTKTFRISHPLPEKNDTHYLLHSSIEGPQADLIYRGRTDLVSGTVDVNIDTAAGMTEGTFEVLCGDVQCFTSNEDGWTALKGSVTGNVMTITAQDDTCTDTVSWMVIGERKDAKMIESEWADNDGKLIVETLKSEH